ncbi:StbB family protein [Photobacterium damselae]|uniref:StbB family protein n=1 Tax=Photobacterium damselae TaxID=38293 RepID=UPI00165E89DC|nr:StbB family protein [Photobacterium damselae]
MKLCVINFSGNVGKSIISQHLLKPRLNDCEIISVETINDNGIDDEKIKSKYFTQIIERVLDAKDIIVDVGASNVEEFMNQMRNSVGSQEEFDYYIIPVTKKVKQINDTISTIAALDDLGIEQDKIRLILNMVEDVGDINIDYSGVLRLGCSATVSENVYICESELFSRLDDLPDFESIAKLANDPTDYRTLIDETEDKDKRSEYIKRLSIKRLAVGVERMLDNTFKHLFN